MPDTYGLINITKEEQARTAMADAILAKTGGNQQLAFDFDGGTGFASQIADIPEGVDITPFLNRTITSVSSDSTVIGMHALAYCSALTTLDMPNLQRVQLYGLHETTNLELTSFTASNIGPYACCRMGANATNPFIYTPASEATVEDHGFEMANISEINGRFLKVGEHAFTNLSALRRIVLTGTPDIHAHAFALSAYVSDVDVSGCSVLFLDHHAFWQLGTSRYDREMPITLDFRNSEFDVVPGYCFADGDNMIIRLPDTVELIQTHAFSQQTNLTLYMGNSTVPELATGDAFESTQSFVVYVPYTLWAEYKHATYWTTIHEDHIRGYAPAGTFTTGQQLPSDDGHADSLTWFCDRELTQRVRECPDAEVELYCTFS